MTSRARRTHIHDRFTLREAAEAAEGMTTAEALAAGILCDGREVLIPRGERELAAITHRCVECGAELVAL